jgi:hypothetical protein
MARTQQGGISAVTVWMIVFVALWLGTTVVLVILYTNQEDILASNRQLKADKARLISASEDRDLEIVKKTGPGQTVVGLIEDQRARTATAATGSGTDDAATVIAKRDAFIDSVIADRVVQNSKQYRDASLLEAIQLIYTEFKANHRILADMKSRMDEQDDRLAQLIETNAAQQAGFAQQAEEIQQKLIAAEQDAAQRIETRATAVTDLEQKFDGERARADATLTAARNARAQAEDRLGTIQQRYDHLVSTVSDVVMRPEQLTTARQPDGRILKAMPGDEVVYIDLGRNAQLTLGMQFAVYSNQTGIPPDGQGKARIEVVAIHPDYAECRIVRVFGNNVILQDDLIANPVYDRSRRMNFVVVGDFDMNRDGQPDRDGTETIESLIKGWGGHVSPDLGALTDFVILGAAPPKPRAVGTVAAGDVDVADRARQAYQRYQDTVETARELSVPVLTQDVFMSFLGYSGRLASR